ncbi:hypothetical protein QZH41_008390, partial [Actinostola sp. cb2023]
MTLHPNGSLEITSLKAHDETHYQCLVRAPGRRDSHLIDLSVACDGKITITKRQVCIEEQVHLECEAKHRTNPRHIKRVTWHKKATDASWSLAAASDRHGDLKLNQNGSLVLKAGRKEGDEEYRCAVSKTNAWRDERHIITLKNVNCRRERRQIANIKTTTGRVGMTTSAPIKGTKVSMETTTVPSSTPNQAAKELFSKILKNIELTLLGCGGTLAAPTGGFQSPNFPSAYPANSYCKWTISVPQDYAAIHIKLDQMNLEHEDDCLNDYIAIYDELGNEVGCRRCGAYNSPIETKIRGRVARLTVTRRQVCTEKDIVLDCKPKHRIERNHGTITWHKKKTYNNKLSWSRIADTDTTSEGSKLHGNGSLWLRGGRTEGEKVYRCVVAKGNARSREMHLTVVKDVTCHRERRQTEGSSRNVRVCIGDEVKLPCRVFEHVNISQVRTMKWRVRRAASPKHFQQLAHSKPKQVNNETIFVNAGLAQNVTRLHDSKVDSVGLEPNGSLLIKSIRDVDEGDFECIVKTRHHHEPIRETLHVKPVKCNQTATPTSLVTKATNNKTADNRVAMTTKSTVTTSRIADSMKGPSNATHKEQETNQNSTVNQENSVRRFSVQLRSISTSSPSNSTSSPPLSSPSSSNSTSSPPSYNNTSSQPLSSQSHSTSSPPPSNSTSSPPLSSPSSSNSTSSDDTTQNQPSTSARSMITNSSQSTALINPTMKTTTSTSTWSVIKTSIPAVRTTIVTTVTTSITTIATSGKETGSEEVTSKPDKNPIPTERKTDCGGTLTAPTGGFQSPNFPSAYPANSYCKWTISVPQDYAAIHIKLDQMNLEHEESCLNDYIAIYDELGNQVGSRRCGAYTKPIEFQVRGRVAVIEFKSDHSVEKAGFKLTYQGVM